MRMRLLLPATLLAAAALMPACGGPDPAPGGSPSPTLSPSPTSGGGSQLTVVYDDGESKMSTWQLSCDPAGGDHPDPTAACAALTKKGATALPEVSKDKMCTQQFGGPQSAVLTGTWQGQPVDSRLKRSDGCEISRWDSLAGLLPRVGK
jgi:hypothetical protein